MVLAVQARCHADTPVPVLMSEVVPLSCCSIVVHGEPNPSGASLKLFDMF